jgi:hypothetical protein
MKPEGVTSPTATTPCKDHKRSTVAEMVAGGESRASVGKWADDSPSYGKNERCAESAAIGHRPIQPLVRKSAAHLPTEARDFCLASLSNATGAS